MNTRIEIADNYWSANKTRPVDYCRDVYDVQQIGEHVQPSEESTSIVIIQTVLEFLVLEFVEVNDKTLLIDQRVSGETCATAEVGRHSGTAHGQIDHEGIAQIVVGIARPVLDERCRP